MKLVKVLRHGLTPKSWTGQTARLLYLAGSRNWSQFIRIISGFLFLQNFLLSSAPKPDGSLCHVNWSPGIS